MKSPLVEGANPPRCRVSPVTLWGRAQPNRQNRRPFRHYPIGTIGLDRYGWVPQLHPMDLIQGAQIALQFRVHPQWSTRLHLVLQILPFQKGLALRCR